MASDAKLLKRLGKIFLTSLCFFFFVVSIYGNSILVQPKNNEVITTATYKFVWNEVATADNYLLVGSLSQSFEDSLFSMSSLNTNITLDIGDFNQEEVFWKVIAKSGTDIIFTSGVSSFYVLNPLALDDLLFWYIPDSNVVTVGSNVLEWPDLSGNGYTLNQANPNFRPFLNSNAFGDRKGITFDGANDRLLASFNQTLEGPFSFFIVYSNNVNAARTIFDGINSTERHRLFWALGLGGLGFFAGQNIAIPQSLPHSAEVIAIISNSSESEMFRNAILTTTGNAGSNNLSGITLGTAFDGLFAFGGSIFEFIGINSALDSDQVDLVNEYLMQRFAPPLNLGPDTLLNTLCSVTLNAGAQFQSYLWSNGSTGQAITISQPGIYHVTVSDLFGRQYSDTLQLFYPELSVVPAMGVLCLGETLNLNASIANSENYDFLWNTGADTQEIDVLTGGLYSVSVTDPTSENCLTLTSEVQITLDSFPESLSLPLDTALCAGNSIFAIPPFEALSQSDYQFSWSDGTEANNLTPTTSGTYSVSVTNSNDCVAFRSIDIELEGVAPDVQIEAIESVCKGESIELNGTSTAEIVEWKWTILPINTTFLGQNSEISVETAGQYLIELRVIDMTGCVGVAFDTLEVLKSPESAFAAGLACVSFPVSFDNDSEIPLGTSVESYEWTLNGEIESNETNPIFTFSNTGTYDVSLVTLLDNGCADMATSQIEIPETAPALILPSLIYPTDGAVLFDPNIAFQWQNDPNTLSCALEISNEQSEIVQEFGAADNNVVVSVTPATYTWGLKCINACRDTFPSTLRNVTYLDLVNRFEPIAWYAADAIDDNSGATISEWVDLSGNGNNAQAPSQVNRPILINDEESLFPMIDFNGSNQRLRTLFDQSYHDSFTTFFLWKLNGTNAQTVFDGVSSSQRHRIFYSIGTNSIRYADGTDFGYPKAVPIPWTMNSLFSGLTTKFIRENGVEKVSGIAGVNSLTGLSIGATFDNQFHMNGRLAEMIFINDSLAIDEIEEIEAYLFFKYGPPVNLGPDKKEYGFCPINIDAGSHYLSYNWNTGDTTRFLEVSQSGIYNVEVVDIFGRISTDEIEVIFPGEFLSTDFFVCFGDTFVYDINLDASSYDIAWSTGNDTPSISIGGTLTFNVTVNDTLGCSYISPVITATIDSLPETSTLIDLPTFCLGNELFLSSGFEDAETYLWSTDEDTPFIQPQESGEYWVEAKSANGCVGRDTVQVDIVGVAPEAAFTVGTACEENEVVFSDVTVPDGGTIISWLWSFPESSSGQAPSEPATSALYDNPGNYPVELTVTLDNGCTGTIRDTVEVNPLPFVDFNFDEVIPCAGNEVAFESQSVVSGGGSIASYAWAFSNGGTDTGIVGSTTFEEQGPQDIMHVVTSSDGCVDSLEATIVVLGSPIVNFELEDVCIGTPAVFQEDVDISESGSVFYNWQFGDGFFSNFPNTSHAYSNPGVYNVQLTATGNNFGVNGCTDALIRQIRVFEAPDAEIELEDACLGAGIPLTDLTIASEEGGQSDPISSRSWTWITGPGFEEEIATDSAATWFPGADGIFTIGFDLTTESGCEASATAQATVLEIPEAAFELELPLGTPPLSATPENNSLDAEGFTWSINGLFLSNAAEPEIVFPEAGEYMVQLVAQNSLECNDTTFQSFTVIDPEYDVAILNISFRQVGTRLELTALLSNQGNAPITDFDMNVVVGQDIDINQSIEHLIMPGDVVSYPLPTDFVYDAGRVLPYTCIKVSNPNGVGENELDLTNNETCIGLNKERPTFIAPYPNPAGDLLNLGFILPEDGTVELEIVSTEGKLMERFDLELKEGYNLVEYAVNGYAEGIYFIRYSFGGVEEVRRLVVAR